VAVEGGVGGNLIYTSTDGGVNWDARVTPAPDGSTFWTGVTSNAAGDKLAAVVGGGYIYTSVNGGLNWTERTGAGSLNWSSIASDSTGDKLVATVLGGYIWTSTDGGATWSTKSNSSGSAQWKAVASSSLGDKLVAVTATRYIYTSVNGGTSWQQRTDLTGSVYLNGVASSSDGVNLAVATARLTTDYVYLSTNSGVSWSPNNTLGDKKFTGVASDSTGNIIAVTVSNGYIYRSNNGGVSWADQVNAGSQDWVAIASNAAGDRLIAVPTSGSIWTYVLPIASATMTTGAATSVTADSATLNGTVTATGGDDPEVWFEYGEDTEYGMSTTVDGPYEAGDSYTAEITGLDCETTYHFKSFGSNSAGTGKGSDAEFTTGSCVVAPTVTTDAVSNITQTSVTLNGTISNTGGENATTHFEYGATASYGTSTAEVADTGAISYSVGITGLSCGTVYHYETYAENSAGESNGGDQTFTTSACSRHTSSGSYAPGFGPARTVTTTPATPSAQIFTFTKNLKFLQIDNEVKELQKFLNTHGYPVATIGAGSLGNETNKFGSLTQKALIKFQLANKITPAVGYFGPITRALVNSLNK
jgi:hypothetical protein